MMFFICLLKKLWCVSDISGGRSGGANSSLAETEVCQAKVRTLVLKVVDVHEIMLCTFLLHFGISTPNTS